MTSQLFFPNLTRAQRQALESHHVCAIEFQLGSEQGVLVDSAQLAEALAAVKMSAARTSNTQFVGIFHVTLEAVANGPTCRPRAADSTSTIATIVAEMERLQGWANLTDTERTARQVLSSAVQTLQTKLADATVKLTQDSSKLAEIKEHVDGLVTHQLPSELTDPLQIFVTAAAEELKQTRAAFDSAVSELHTAREALANDLNKRRLSPEAMLAQSEATLAQAQQASELNLPSQD